MIHGKTKGILFVLLCVALWALIPVVAKTGQSRMDHHQFLFWSSLVSFVVLFGTAVIRRTAGEISKYSVRDWWRLLFLGLLGTYIYYLFLYFGYAHAIGLEVLVIQYTWPILIVLFSIFLLKERLTGRKAVAIILGFIGVVFVLTKGNFADIHMRNFAVIALVGCGSLCFALFSVLSKTVTFEPVGVAAVYFLSATIASFISMMIFSTFAWPSLSAIAPVLVNGMLVNGFSYVFWIIALQSTEASYLAPFTFTTPILSAVYLIVFFQESFHPTHGIGLICVVGGGLVNSINLNTTKNKFIGGS